MVTVKTKITDERLQDLLCCALEGGSNYWYRITSYNYPPGQNADTLDIEYQHLELPFKGGSITIQDQFDDFPEKELDSDSIMSGLQKFEQVARPHYYDFISDNEDAITGDIFLTSSPNRGEEKV